jgi:hypothetical protein
MGVKMQPLATTDHAMPRTAKPTTEARSITFRFHLPLYQRLERAAAADSRSINSMAALLLQQALDARKA